MSTQPTQFTHAPQPCPACGEELSVSTLEYGEGGPEPGAATVCAFCATDLKVVEGLRLERLTQADFLALGREAQTALIRANLKVQRARRRRLGGPALW